MSLIKLSRFAVEKSIQCSRCFWLHYRHKINLSGFPFTLNLAVDNLVKNEFDHYRKIQKPHPIFEKNGIDAVPFEHIKMNDWRNNFKGAYHHNEEEGYIFGGAIDDIWQKRCGELIVADVKATSKNKFDWSETFQRYNYPKAYQRQLEMYQWVFKKFGYDVADEGYLLYFNGRKNEDMFNNELKFDTHLVKLDCSVVWVEKQIKKARDILLSDDLPDSSKDCDTCNYIKQRWNLHQSDVNEFIDRCSDKPSPRT